MGLDVIGIDELADLPVFAGGGGLQLFDLFDDQVYVALGARSEHEFCAVGTDGLFALVAHAIGHDDDDGVAFGGANAGGGDAGIAGGAFNDGHAWKEVAATLCLRDEKG